MMPAILDEQLREMVEDGAMVLPLTVEQYHQLIAAGVVPEGEPFELLNGYVIRKDRSAAGEGPMTVGPEHAWVIRELTELNPRLRRFGCHMQIQLPVSLPPWNEPEPDAAIAIGTKDDYRDRHPGAKDVLCVIEVADSSLHRDRTTKLRIYAASGIRQYLIINLPDRMVELHTRPIAGSGRAARYAQVEMLKPGQTIELPAPRGKGLKIAVRRLLP
jgi:Uma2 family endonuclease